MANKRESGHKPILVNRIVYDWLLDYILKQHLSSFNQAIEFLIRESGYTINTEEI
jgi:hypothetical protein